MAEPTAARPRVRVKASVLGAVRDRVAAGGLRTVCEGALCPNRPECYAAGHLTLLILGDRCTRACRFCAVSGGPPEAPDPAEPGRIAEMVGALGMGHVVVTSVTRDDLPDGGAAHYEAVGRALAALPAPPTAEALVPDFGGDPAAVARVAGAAYRLLAHNVETVPRLYPRVRPQAVYRRSLEVLATLGRAGGGRPVKSGLMLGLGETGAEVRAVLEDLRRVGVAAVTLGQYLQPTAGQLAPVRRVPAEEFAGWAETARALGFRSVVAGPLVRSSYRARLALESFASGGGA